MFKLFNKKRGKKGFTLAELLVVVAIIAILVAIAIPIFTGALDRAREAVMEADIRSVKAAAVTEILSNWDTYGYTSGRGSAINTKWIAKATVEASGDIGEIKISAATNESAATVETAEATGTGGYNVTVGITSVTATKE